MIFMTREAGAAIPPIKGWRLRSFLSYVFSALVEPVNCCCEIKLGTETRV